MTYTLMFVIGTVGAMGGYTALIGELQPCTPLLACIVQPFISQYVCSIAVDCCWDVFQQY